MTPLPAPTPDEKGVLIYTLTPDISLFRGSGDKRSPGNAPLKYFAFMREEAAKYGVVREYRALRTLNLVALDVDNPVFYDGAHGVIKSVQRKYKGRERTIDIEIQEALQRNFGFGTSASEPRLRESDNGRDSIIAKYCCEKGYDGYAISRMRTHGGGVFHAETAICRTGENVELYDDTAPAAETAPLSPTRQPRSPTSARATRHMPRTPASSRKGRRLFGTPYSGGGRKKRQTQRRRRI